MKRLTRRTILAAAPSALAVATLPAYGQKKYGPGVTDSEIKIGNTAFYTGPASSYGTIGKAMAAIIEASETWRVVSKTTSQIKKMIGTASGINPMSAPADVATPLPPLKQSQTGKVWPTTAIIAPRIATYSTYGFAAGQYFTRTNAARAAANPLNMSIRKTG